MPYVQRDENGGVKGLYANLQAGYAGEFLADDDAEVVAYRKPPPSAEQLRIAALAGNARTKAIATALTTKDDAGLIAAVAARYPGLTGDGLKAVTDIALALATIYRA